MDTEKPLKWFYSALTQLVEAFGLQSIASRSTLAIELVITALLALCIVLFLAHDVLWLIASFVTGNHEEFHAFQVFIVSVIVLVFSLIAIFLIEWAIAGRKH